MKILRIFLLFFIFYEKTLEGDLKEFFKKKNFLKNLDQKPVQQYQHQEVRKLPLFGKIKKDQRKLDDTINVDQLSDYVSSLNSTNPIVYVNQSFNTTTTNTTDQNTTDVSSVVSEVLDETVAQNCTIFNNGTYDINGTYFQTNLTTSIQNLTSYTNFTLCQYAQTKDPDLYYVKHPLVYDPNDKFGLGALQNSEATKMTFHDINTLLSVISAMNTTFVSLYESMPTSTSSSSSSGGLSTTINILKFYAKLRSFLTLVLNSRTSIVKQANYLAAKLNTMTFTRSDMIVFYDESQNYSKAQLKIVAMRRDDRIKSLNKDIDQMAEDFSTKGAAVLKGGSTFMAYIANFMSIIYELQNQENSYSVMQVLSTFDKIISISIKLLENKLELQNAFTNLKSGLSTVLNIKYELKETIKNINDLDKDKYKAQLIKSTWIHSIYLIVFAFLIQ